LLAVDYFKPVDSINSETSITFFQTSESLIANRALAADESLPPEPGDYINFEVAYGTLLRRHGPPQSGKEWEAYRDIVEAGFVNWLANTYTGAWQIEQRTIGSFIGSMGRLTSPLADKEKTPKKVSVAELGKLFGNQLVAESDR